MNPIEKKKSTLRMTLDTLKAMKRNSMREEAESRSSA